MAATAVLQAEKDIESMIIGKKGLVEEPMEAAVMVI